MIFNYEKDDFVQPNGEIVSIFRSILPFTLSKRGSKLLPIDGLLDSGADMIIFPAKIAEFFEINYKKGMKIDVGVAGGYQTYVYRLPYKEHKISILVNGIEIKESIDFSVGQKHALLGQDFFKWFKITFDRNAAKFELKQVK